MQEGSVTPASAQGSLATAVSRAMLIPTCTDFSVEDLNGRALLVLSFILQVAKAHGFSCQNGHPFPSKYKHPMLSQSFSSVYYSEHPT